ncbi:hypothetical protein AX15_004178 [Amanita polypyramis BW_CC]|nr:hypothetical protein AX15_004178 [Amanita polypyramis BW_CC]
MATRLRILAGPCPNNLVPITDIVNTSTTHKVSSDLFKGEIAVYIKYFTDKDGDMRHSDYFQRGDRQGITWSIQVSGRFLEPQSADDILFGNIFDRPLYMPWGSSAALKFMQYTDPTLEHDLFSQTKPWALSPLIATMPHFAHKRIESDGKEDYSLDVLPQSHSWNDFTAELYRASVVEVSSSESSISSMDRVPGDDLDKLPISNPDDIRPDKGKKRRKSTARKKELQFETATLRREYFNKAEHRQAIQFGPEDIISTDFCYGFLEFNPSIALRLPGGLSFDLMRYWDGQPVKFVCCERKKYGCEEAWGRVFWCVVIERA